MHNNNASLTRRSVSSHAKQNDCLGRKVSQDSAWCRKVDVWEEGLVRQVGRSKLIQRLRQATLMVIRIKLRSESDLLRLVGSFHDHARNRVDVHERKRDAQNKNKCDDAK